LNKKGGQVMKTTAKWISENNYILNNSKHLNLAISDPVKRQDNYEINCLDLVLMGFAGCITAEFKKQIFKQSILLKGIETDVEIDTLPGLHPCFKVHAICRIVTNAKNDVLKKCLDNAIGSSLLGILFRDAGIPVDGDIVINTPARYAESQTA